MNARPAALAPVNLASLARQVVKHEGAQNVASVGMDETLQVRAEPDLLARALGNAVRNAVRYAGDDRPITIMAVPSSEKTAS